MDTVIITGANGFIGSSLVNRLLKDNIEIYALDIDFSNRRLPYSSLIHTIEVNLDDVDKVVQQLKNAENCDAFYHFAWQGVNGADKANPYIQLNNIKTALICGNVAKLLNCGKFLCSGTIAEQGVNSLPFLRGVYGGMLYSVAKHNAHLFLETYCKSINQKFVWMQFSNSFGIGNRTGNLVSYTLQELLSGREPSFGPAEQPYDFIYIDDLMEAVYRLGYYDTPKSTYFIGSGHPRLLKDYLFSIGELCENKEAIKIGVRPDDGVKYDMAMFDTSSLVNDIGNYISTSFEDGIRRTIKWMKDNE